ncbi:MAG: EAL domain-containing protein [Vallitaleaceae bacterium]|jgi:diguanylate cyclase (GGDEF)-like protein|nr:EAL domain-containing protein [Vallitaleaceae bacterium]
MQGYNQKAIICANHDAQLLEQLELYLLGEFGQGYVIETGKTPSETLQVMASLELLEVSNAVLLVSYSMPEQIGIDFIKQINQLYPKCRTILLAGKISGELIEPAFNDVNLNRFIKIPYKKEVLKQMVIDELHYYEQDYKLTLLNEKLKQSEYEKGLILESISKEMFFIDEQYDILWLNTNEGYKDLKTWANGKCYEQLFGRHKPCDHCQAMKVFEKDEPISQELGFPNKLYKIVSYYPVRDKDDKPLGVVIAMIDITGRRLRENMSTSLLEMSKYVYHVDHVMAVYEKAYSLISEMMPLTYMCVAGKDYDNVFLEFLDGDDKLLSCTKSIVESSPYLEERMEKRDQLKRNGLEYEIDQSSHDYELEILFVVENRIAILRFDYAYQLMEYEINYIRGIIEQVRIGISRIESIKHMTYQVNHDGLTGLFNKDYFMKTLDGKIKSNRDKETVTAFYGLAVIDLNYFKDINDTFGHVVGDEVLYIVAKNILNVLRQGDVIARIGGDEFALLITYQTREEIGFVLSRIQEAISEIVQVQTSDISIGSSIGVVADIYRYSNAEAAIGDADIAMYEAKHDKIGPGSYRFFEKDIEEKIKLNQVIEEKLKKAIHENEFRLKYQPIISIETGQIVGVEALLRWTDSMEETYEPSIFIPVAEDAGMMHKINDHLIDEVNRAIKTFDECFIDNQLFISINFSSKQLMNKAYLSKLGQMDIDFNRLIIEITEKPMFKNYDKAKEHILFLMNLGLRVHLDDFGTGFSSLVHLNKTTIDHIKIDHDLVRNLPEDTSALRIVKAIIHVAKSMNKHVTAEGIENREQLTLLSELGCDFAQGYHISKPLDLDQVILYYSLKD